VDLSIDRNSKLLEDTTFRKLALFLFSDERRDTTVLLDPLERADLNHCVENPCHITAVAKTPDTRLRREVTEKYGVKNCDKE
jgi:hypothetical protein